MTIRLGYSLLTVRPREVGGAETYVRALLGALAQRSEVEQVTVFANREVMRAYASLASSRISMMHMKGMDPTGSSLTRASRLALALANPSRVVGSTAGRVDVVHFPVAVGIPEPTIPHVVTLHDVAHHAVPEHFSRVQRMYRAVAYDRSARRANTVITVSEHARDQIVKFLGVDPKKVIAIPHGVDLERYAPGHCLDDTVTLASLALPKRFVYYPANLWPHKNHCNLVAAMGYVSDSSLHLVLTGQTYGRYEELRKLSVRMGVADRVHHLGYVSANAVPALYRACIGVVFPSLFEGFGSPPLEAMACGAPVAATRCGSLREVLGGVALDIDPHDPRAIAASIDKLAGDPKLRNALSSAGIAHAKTFTWEWSAQQHVGVYQALMRHTGETVT